MLAPLPSFASIAGNTLTISPTQVADAGIVAVTLTAGLVSYPARPTIQVSFQIIVVCTVTSLSFATSPPNLTILQVSIDTQPALIAFAVTKTPNCPQAVTFAFSGTPPAFLSLQNQLNTSGDVQVTNATIADHGSYPLTLTAAVDA